MFVFSGLYCLTYFSDASLFGPIICPPRLTSRPGRDPEGGAVRAVRMRSPPLKLQPVQPRALRPHLLLERLLAQAQQCGLVLCTQLLLPQTLLQHLWGGSGRKLRALHPGSRPGSTTAEQTGRASLLGLCQDQPLPMGAVLSPGEGGRWLQEAFLDCPHSYQYCAPLPSYELAGPGGVLLILSVCPARIQSGHSFVLQRMWDRPGHTAVCFLGSGASPA